MKLTTCSKEVQRKRELLKILDDPELGDLPRAEYQRELDEVQLAINTALRDFMADNDKKIRNERPSLKGKTKNEQKKILAQYFMDCVKDLDKNTCKGIFRQAYKSY